MNNQFTVNRSIKKESKREGEARNWLHDQALAKRKGFHKEG